MIKTTCTPLSDKYWSMYEKEITDFCTALMGSELEGYMQSHYVKDALRKKEIETLLSLSESDVKIFIFTTARNRCIQRLAWKSVNPIIGSVGPKRTLLQKIISFFKQSIAKYYA